MLLVKNLGGNRAFDMPPRRKRHKLHISLETKSYQYLSTCIDLNGI